MKRLYWYYLFYIDWMFSLSRASIFESQYQQPAICKIVKRGRFSLQPDFIKYNIILNMEWKELSTGTVCKDDKTIYTNATVQVMEYIKNYQNDNYINNDDYQWKRVVLKLSFDDDNIVENGVSVNYLTTNYYNIGQYVSTYNYNYDESYYEFTVNYYGIDYLDCKLIISTVNVDWQSVDNRYIKEYIFTFDFNVPKDFDGIVVGVRNAAIDSGSYTYFYEYYDSEQFLWFRLD